MTHMQYYHSEDPTLNVGDPMPYWHDGVFHLFYLIDKNHHAELGGLGGHQWAHASSTDLVNWEHHPLAIPLGEKGKDLDWTSICTGAVFEHEGTFYAFYATRIVEDDGTRRGEAVCLSTSADCTNFTKSPNNHILYPPEGFLPNDYRDPFVFQDDDGVFHMLVTASQEIGHRLQRGALAHLTSNDLAEWTLQKPFLVTGFPMAPECPDYFKWGDWYYLTFLHHGQLRYRMSRDPFGPWECPAVDTIDGMYNAAAKTAQFGENRRLAVGFVRSNFENRDDSHSTYAGNAVFRELYQLPDGQLRSTFPPEMMPACGESLPLAPAEKSGSMDAGPGCIRLLAEEEGCALADTGVKLANGRITCTIATGNAPSSFGFGVRCSEDFNTGYEIRFRPHEKTVLIRNVQKGMMMDDDRPMASLFGVDGLDGTVTVDIVLHDDIIDLCVNGERCLIARYPEWTETGVLVFCENGSAEFGDGKVRERV